MQLAEGIEDGSLPLTVAEVSENSEAPVSPQVLRNLIQSYRQIELETQADTELPSLDFRFQARASFIPTMKTGSERLILPHDSTPAPYQ